MGELEIAESNTKTDLTSTQKETGNYPKGKVTLNGIPITIENPKGSYRSGYSSGGVFWKSKMYYTYGFIDNTIGSDGDEIDIFLGPLCDTEKDFLVYIINQVNPDTNLFDEHKIMFGFNNSLEAREAYLSCYEQGWGGLGSMSQISLKGFGPWLGNKRSKVFSNQLNPIKNEVVVNQNERIKLIKLEGEVIVDKTLLNLQKQAGELTNIDTLVVSIGSPGGDVSEGIRIMMWFDYLSSNGIKVVTLVVSNAYSIASLIMLAADHTLIAKDADVMVHNPMVPELKFVNANELEQHIKDLRELESTMYDLYEVFTDLPKQQIKELMDNETYLNAETAIRLGFADEIANIEKQPKVMATSKIKIVNMKKTLNILHQVIALVGNSPIVNQCYYDDAGGEIEVYQQDPSGYKTGDRTSVENGQVKLMDGTVLNIKDWLIDSIEKTTPATPTTEAPVAPVESVVAPTPAPAQAGFNEGPAPAAPVIEEPKPVEMKTEVTKTETTKTEPVMVAGEPASPGATPVVVEEPKAVVPAPVAGEGLEIEVEKPIAPKPEGEETITVPLKDFQNLVARVEAIEKVQNGVQKQMTESTKFEEIATEAISMLAKNTTSNFKAGAKAVVGETPKGSIFQQAKARVAEAKGK